jgi:hypothetical protein
MEYRMKDIFEQAIQDTYAVNLDSNDYQARMVFGCKIIRDNNTGETRLLNTAMGGHHYKKLDSAQLQYFFEGGWRYGCYKLALDNYKIKLERVEVSIKAEMNGKKNPKQIQSLKNSRERLMNKYKLITDKLLEL